MVFPLCCQGVRVELGVSPKQVHFDKLLLHRSATWGPSARAGTRAVWALWLAMCLLRMGLDRHLSSPQQFPVSSSPFFAGWDIPWWQRAPQSPAVLALGVLMHSRAVCAPVLVVADSSWTCWRSPCSTCCGPEPLLHQCLSVPSGRARWFSSSSPNTTAVQLPFPNSLFSGCCPPGPHLSGLSHRADTQLVPPLGLPQAASSHVLSIPVSLQEGQQEAGAAKLQPAARSLEAQRAGKPRRGLLSVTG